MVLRYNLYADTFFYYFCIYQVMFTLLTQLELGEVQFLRLFPQINVTCSLSFHKVGSKFVSIFCLSGSSISLLACQNTSSCRSFTASGRSCYHVIIGTK